MAALAAGDEVLPRKRTMPVLDGGDSQPCTTSRTSAPDSGSSRTATSVAPRTVSVVSATVLSMPTPGASFNLRGLHIEQRTYDISTGTGSFELSVIAFSPVIFT